MSEKIPIFIINLKKDIERKKHMETLCKQHNLQCQFIEAVYGKDLNEDTISKIYNKDKSIHEIGRELTKGELGCALSHLKIYQHMVEKNIKQAIIFEDDIQITEDFSSIIQSIDTFTDDWELILLGYYRGDPSKEKKVKSYLRYKKKVTNKHKLVRLKELAAGAHGYLINLQGAKKLTKELSTIQIPVDHYTGDDNYINLYAISPRVIMLNTMFSYHSSLDLDRNKVAKEYNHAFNKKYELIYYKVKKELVRPFKRLLTFFKPLRKYK